MTKTPDSSKCGKCGAAWVAHGGTWKTLVGYGSPEGHDHDDNCLKRIYRCANGHEDVLSVQRRCSTPGCEWVGKATCFCCEPKVKEWPTGDIIANDGSLR